jgi:drug/metabolite transporter (DMT)-like permease
MPPPTMPPICAPVRGCSSSSERSPLVLLIPAVLLNAPSVIRGGPGTEGIGCWVIIGWGGVYGGGVAFGAFVKVMSIGTSNLLSATIRLQG